ncbi:beta-ketoacyl-[acyl-carrier-protein] synthase family protein [Gorillibacterium sp. sgz500922]|uniref:beta-ketoacyl-[acyl-carrier-protein] synthase family protein n=1 Tax=Gorillibacterium sp. sgz500922 TaxID=3446694 RepID=UPI003F67D12B
MIFQDNNRAVVTGIGVIAANGLSREPFYQSIIGGASGLRESEMLRRLETRSIIAGEVPMDFEEMEEPSDNEKITTMAYLALSEAFEDSGVCREEIESLHMRAGLSFSTSLAGNQKTLRYMKNKREQKQNDPRWLVEKNSSTSRIAHYAGVRGPVYTTMSACAAGTAGAGLAMEQIRNGTADVVVVVGADPLTEFSPAGFHSLKSMSITGCRPFDKDRDGMSLGEGAAAFIVESLRRARDRGAHIYGELCGYGLGNDAYHMTSPDPNGTGAYRTMKMALEDARVSLEELDYINAHGTATELNDVMETNALTKLYGDSPKKSEVMISSTKSMTGHCLGAAGSVELAVVLLALDRGMVPGTAKLEEPAEDFQCFRLIKESVAANIDYAMSNSFAFAGNTSSIVVGKVEEENNG